MNSINTLRLPVQSSDLGEAACKGPPFKASLVFFGSTYKDSGTDITALPVTAKGKGSKAYWARFLPPSPLCVLLLETRN